MKVFISWSGETSHELALALYGWLPQVLQSVEPWVSSEDIAKGAFWNAELVAALKESSFGLCCITPDNVGSPWMAFEAGAMIQHQSKPRVSPVLLGLKPTDAIGLYGNLQHTQLTLGDVTKLLQSINKGAEKPTPDAIIKPQVERLWPELEATAKRILGKVKPADTAKAKRDVEDILEDLVELVRSQSNQLTNLGNSVGLRTAPPYYIPGGSALYIDPSVGGSGYMANFARMGFAPDPSTANTPLALAAAAAQSPLRAAALEAAQGPTAVRAAAVEAATGPTVAQTVGAQAAAPTAAEAAAKLNK